MMIHSGFLGNLSSSVKMEGMLEEGALLGKGCLSWGTVQRYHLLWRWQALGDKGLGMPEHLLCVGGVQGDFHG